MMDRRTTNGGASKVRSLPKEDRRSHIQKIGAKFLAKKLFCVPDQGVEAAGFDLFGAPLDVQAVFSMACDECGDRFDQVVRPARPRRFCSDACRLVAKRRQQRAWAKTHQELAPAVLSCRRCGAAFQPPPRSAGRAPYWCSPACKRAEHRRRDPEPSGQDRLDFTSSSPPKGKTT